MYDDYAADWDLSDGSWVTVNRMEGKLAEVVRADSKIAGPFVKENASHLEAKGKWIDNFLMVLQQSTGQLGKSCKIDIYEHNVVFLPTVSDIVPSHRLHI